MLKQTNKLYFTSAKYVTNSVAQNTRSPMFNPFQLHQLDIFTSNQNNVYMKCNIPTANESVCPTNF